MTNKQKHIISSQKRARIFLIIAFVFIINYPLHGEENEYTTTKVLGDGTTITHRYNEFDEIIREDIVLYSGRHKATFFDEGQPKYGVVTTGTGSFGLMYYDRKGGAPLFKFWEYADKETMIQFYSTNLTPIGSIRLDTVEGERVVRWEGEETPPEKPFGFMLLFSISGLALGFLLGFFIFRRGCQK